MIDYDIGSFVPTDLQLLTKLKLHQFVAPSVIGGLTVDKLARVRHYLYPVEIEDVMAWSASSPVFWFWFTMPNEQVLRLTKLRGQAVDAMESILTGQEVDSKMAGVKLKAAQMLLSLSESAAPQVTKNTMNVTGHMEIPKELAKKSVADLQSEITRLKQLEAVDASFTGD